MGASTAGDDKEQAQVACTYDHCDETFATVKDMQRHKGLADLHYWCKKCDLDFDSDIKFIMHRIVTTDKHITCPECGTDFKSRGGQARHVEQRHPHKQLIPCLACGKRLAGSAMVIKHVEDGQCVITPQEWRLERTERTVAKEAFLARYEQKSLSYIAPMSDDGSQNGGVSLLDGPANTAAKGPSSQPKTGEHTSVMSMDEIAEAMSKTGLESQSEWQREQASMPMFQAGTSSVSSLRQATPMSGSYDTRSQANSTFSQTSTTFKLADFWCPIREVFVCPGTSCGAVFPKAESFHAHLSSRAHISGNITCPSCLRHFASYHALLSHMEAPSRKCNIRHSVNYNQVLREITAGLVGTGGHHEDGGVKYIMPEDEGWQA